MLITFTVDVYASLSSHPNVSWSVRARARVPVVLVANGMSSLSLRRSYTARPAAEADAACRKELGAWPIDPVVVSRT